MRCPQCDKDIPEEQALPVNRALLKPGQVVPDAQCFLCEGPLYRNPPATPSAAATSSTRQGQIRDRLYYAALYDSDDTVIHEVCIATSTTEARRLLWDRIRKEWWGDWIEDKLDDPPGMNDFGIEDGLDFFEENVDWAHITSSTVDAQSL